MAYTGGTMPEKKADTIRCDAPNMKFSSLPDGQPRYLVTIINKLELELLEELLTKNAVQYHVCSGSHHGKKRRAGKLSALGKDIYVDGAHYSRAKAVLADYYLGGEQTTADTNTVPASRRQQGQMARHQQRYPVKRLILWLLLAVAGYSIVFVLWMSLMN